MKDIDNVLAHFGIKGMKWGVRRDNPSGSSEGTSQTVSRKGKTTEISDSELQKRVKRLQLEKQYDDLIKQENEKKGGALAYGAKFVGGVVESAAKQVATQLLVKEFQGAVEYMRKAST